MKRARGWWLGLLLFTSACRFIGGTVVSTPPFQSVPASPGAGVVPTETATPWTTPSPTETTTVTPSPPPVVWPTLPPRPSPIASLPWPSPTYTPAPTPWGDVPYAPVQILRPGIEAAVVSPIDFYAQVYRSMTPSIVHLELWTQWEEEPRLLYRQVLRLYPPRDGGVKFFYLREDIPFEIRPAYAWGRLQVVVRDLDGLPLMQQAVHLRLLRYGVDEPSARQQLRLPIVVKSPREGAVLPLKGTLQLEGLALSTTGRVEILMYNREGRILMATSAPLSAPDPQGYAVFSLDWPYEFAQRQDMRLVFQLYDTRVEGVAYLVSVDVSFR